MWVHTANGVVVARSFKRLPEGARADAQGFNEVIGSPWDLVPMQAPGAGVAAGSGAGPSVGPAEPRISVSAEPVVPEAEIPEPPEGVAAKRPRQV